MLMEKKIQPRKNAVSRKAIFEKWRDKDFPKQKLKVFITARPILQEMIKAFLQAEGKD
jgi:hypothetical protein